MNRDEVHFIVENTAKLINEKIEENGDIDYQTLL
jgi:hypothetical protein